MRLSDLSNIVPLRGCARCKASGEVPRPGVLKPRDPSRRSIKIVASTCPDCDGRCVTPDQTRVYAPQGEA